MLVISIARPIAQRLGAPLCVLLVRKLGVPGQPEVAMGAISENGVRVLNNEIVETLMIAARETALEIRSRIDQLICLAQPHPFAAIGYWYLDFSQVSDEEVMDILLRHSSKFGSVT
ncbi:MAG: hypothetical protein B7X54_04620 [Idiomarina sp. 34-48-12]|nr:MAG: hypothetical protein B7X54_04620 [Idiomarina sp. 34-48-12]